MKRAVLLLLFFLLYLWFVAGSYAGLPQDSGFFVSHSEPDGLSAVSGHPDTDQQIEKKSVMLTATNAESFFVILGDSVLSARNGDTFELNPEYTFCLILARGFKDKRLSLSFDDSDPLTKDLTFTLQKAGRNEQAESRYPNLHWNANLVVSAEPGSRFELNGRRIDREVDLPRDRWAEQLAGDGYQGISPEIFRTEWLPDSTLLLQVAPGNYDITVYYPDGLQNRFDVFAGDRLKHAELYQNPARAQMMKARWIPGRGQSLKHERRKSLTIKSILIGGLVGSYVSHRVHGIYLDDYDLASETYLNAPERADLDKKYQIVQDKQTKVNLAAASRLIFAAVIAGSYIYNVIDASRAPAGGFRRFEGIDPFVDYDVYTGSPAAGIRYPIRRSSDP